MLDTSSPRGDANWICHSINGDGTLNCDSVTYPRADGLLPVRFLGTWNLHVRMRVYNKNGNFRTSAPYRAELQAAARGWIVKHDTGFITDVGEEKQYSEYVTHTWYNNTLGPDDPLTITLLSLSRQQSSFWPDFSLQMTRVWLTVNASLEQVNASYLSWVYGEFESPSPPPPPQSTAGG